MKYKIIAYINIFVGSFYLLYFIWLGLLLLPEYSVFNFGPTNYFSVNYYLLTTLLVALVICCLPFYTAYKLLTNKISHRLGIFIAISYIAIIIAFVASIKYLQKYGARVIPDTGFEIENQPVIKIDSK